MKAAVSPRDTTRHDLRRSVASAGASPGVVFAEHLGDGDGSTHELHESVPGACGQDAVGLELEVEGHTLEQLVHQRHHLHPQETDSAGPSDKPEVEGGAYLDDELVLS